VVQGVIICVRSFGEGTAWVRDRPMPICPRCQEDVPEEMRFCLQCGASLAPTPPPVEADPLDPADPVPQAVPPAAPAPPVTEIAPPPLHRISPTITLKIAPTPVMTPQSGVAGEHPRSRFRDRVVEIDDEESFEGPAVRPGVVVCRFCRGPLDLDGEYCEQCGAPVPEAAPPGTIKPRPQLASPPPMAVPPPSGHAPAATPPPAEPAAHLEPRPTPMHRPAPPVLTAPSTPPAEEQAPGLMGRLKGVFKKG
jgi:hypothetical protein